MHAVIEIHIRRIDEALAHLKFSSDPTIDEAAKYLLLNPGKRIRPLLALLIGQMLGGKLEEMLLPTLALETLHTYSLIHDDLPCMDNDDFRRGKPSLHKVYGEAVALLVGDLLLTVSFELIAKSDLSDKVKIDLISELTAASGGDGMILGQVIDISAEREARRVEMNRKKTGALFIASALFGGIMACATPSHLKTLASFGDIFGLLFQLKDDIDDGELEEDHKEISKLIASAKKTILSLPGDSKAVDLLIETLSMSTKKPIQNL